MLRTGDANIDGAEHVCIHFANTVKQQVNDVELTTFDFVNGANENGIVFGGEEILDARFKGELAQVAAIVGRVGSLEVGKELQHGIEAFTGGVGLFRAALSIIPQIFTNGSSIRLSKLFEKNSAPQPD
jgi:hypothetical protein